MTIDLFRPYVHPFAGMEVAATMAPDENGRIYLGEGSRVQEFERAFGQLVGVSPSSNLPLALNSCTSALDLALHLAGVGPGDEVISTPMTCTATNGVIVNRGARIVWADIDPTTGLIDPSDVARKLTHRTKAIMAVDWAGRSCDYKRLRRTAPNGIPIIQDAAHNLMVDPENKGDLVCWSFQAIKHLTTGDGGALLTPPEQRKRARLLRWYGLDRESSSDFRCDQDITEVGYKYHMNDVAATIGLANLPHMPWVVGKHREHAERYHRLLAGTRGVGLPPPDPKSSWWLYCVQVSDRDGFRAHMAERDIATSPVHARNDKHSAFRFENGPLPGVDSFAAREVAIPVGWHVSDEEIEHIADAVIEWAYGARELVGHGTTAADPVR